MLTKKAWCTHELEQILGRRLPAKLRQEFFQSAVQRQGIDEMELFRQYRKMSVIHKKQKAC